MVLSFEQSGSPVDFSLAEVKDLAVAHRITRQDGAADLDALFKLYGVKALSTFKKKFTTERLLAPAELKAQPPGTPTVAKGLAKVRPRRGMVARESRGAGARGARARTGVPWGFFRHHDDSVTPPSPLPLRPAPQSFEPDKPIACEPLPLAEFEAKSETSVWEKGLKWRLIMRPGGAYIQPDDWYRLYAASNQARAPRAGARGAEAEASRAMTVRLPLPLSLFARRPSRATTRRSAPCGRTTAASTSTGAPPGTRGRS